MQSTKKLKMLANKSELQVFFCDIMQLLQLKPDFNLQFSYKNAKHNISSILRLCKTHLSLKCIEMY